MTVTVQQSPAESLNQVQQAWGEFWSAASAIDDDELARPGVAGEWAAKDVLLHVGRWVETGATEIELHLAGRASAEDYSDYLAWNDRWAAKDQGVDAGTARTRCNDAFTRLLGVLTPLSPEQWDDTVRSWVDNTTTGHFQEHAGQLTAWRAANPASV